jgi:hypothetical protein
MDRPRDETIAGGTLVGLSMVAGLLFHLHPGANRLDGWGFTAIPRSVGSTFLLRITDLGSPAALVIGTVIAALIAVRNDRWRAAACVAGPLLTLALVELVFKPLVARRYLGVLSYPSGNVADIAAVATALVLAVPNLIRPYVLAAGVLAIGLMTTAVIGLRWHYPTDALAGVPLGVGVVLLLDGVLHLDPVLHLFRPEG